MNKYEVIHLVDNFKNYTYFNNKTSAYTFAYKNKPSIILFNRKKIKELK